MINRNPILLSFYGLSNGKQNVFFGKIAYSSKTDLSFKNYSRFRTFRSILALYRTQAVRNHEFEMKFDHGSVRGTTDTSGSFWCETEMDHRQTKLISVTLIKNGKNVSLTEDLYPNRIQSILATTIVISDLDDTLIDSFVSSKFKQLKTLLFTTVEKRKAVVTTAALLRKFSAAGAIPFYLSNSEQNLYPMLYRFLALNEFPAGPLFLRQYVHIRQFIWRKIVRKKNIHKRTILEKLLELFPDKKYILIGDNTQHDLPIYVELARLHPHNIRYVIIREVKEKSADIALVQKAKSELSQYNIGLYYDKEFPDTIPWNL
jgi:phosphatidate phosphatase APP1